MSQCLPFNYSCRLSGSTPDIGMLRSEIEKAYLICPAVFLTTCLKTLAMLVSRRDVMKHPPKTFRDPSVCDLSDDEHHAYGVLSMVLLHIVDIGLLHRSGDLCTGTASSVNGERPTTPPQGLWCTLWFRIYN